jgi:hypothetical protein
VVKWCGRACIGKKGEGECDEGKKEAYGREKTAEGSEGCTATGTGTYTQTGTGLVLQGQVRMDGWTDGYDRTGTRTCISYLLWVAGMGRGREEEREERGGDESDWLYR